MWRLTFLCHTEGENHEGVEGYSQNGIDACAHAVFDQFAFKRTHRWVIDPAADLEDAEAPEDHVLLADVRGQEEAERGGDKGVDKDVLGR
jgi:hypothetical protein